MELLVSRFKLCTTQPVVYKGNSKALRFVNFRTTLPFPSLGSPFDYSSHLCILLIMHVLSLFKSSSNRGPIIPVDIIGGPQAVEIMSLVEFDPHESHITAIVKKKDWELPFFYNCNFKLEDILSIQGGLKALEENSANFNPAQLEEIKAKSRANRQQMMGELQQANMSNAQSSNDTNGKETGLESEGWWLSTIFDLFCGFRFGHIGGGSS